MKVSFILSRVGLAALGALALAGTAAPVRAEGGTATPYAVVEGLVVKSTDVPAGGQGTLVIHQAIGGDVTLNTNGATRFRKAGGKLDTPDENSDGALVPAVQKPIPAWFVGLFARVYYNSANKLALDVALTRPEPLPVTGVVSTASPTEVVLTLEKRGDLHLTLNADTFCRMGGLPGGDGNSFHPGDLAEALFWLTPDSNEAIRLTGRPAPAQRFEGTLGGLATADGAAISFTLTRGASSLNFTVDGNTKVLIDGKPGSFTGLQNGWTVAVVYRKQGDVNLALVITSYTPKPKPAPPTPTPNTGGDKGKGDGDKGQGGNTNTGGDTNKPKPPTPPAPKPPVVVRPVVVEGVVTSVQCDGSSSTSGRTTAS